MSNISEHVTLVQLMDSLGNVNHALGVVRMCIFDSNLQKALVLTIKLFNLICACSDEDQYLQNFKEYFLRLDMYTKKEKLKRVHK